MYFSMIYFNYNVLGKINKRYIVLQIYVVLQIKLLTQQSRNLDGKKKNNFSI